jgi:glycosyltransferase involved in cell wall biosynthesis
VGFIYNPMPIPNAVSSSRSRNEVVFANTLTRKKGILSLIRSWPKVLAERPDAVLHVYGKDKPDKSGRMMKEVLLNELSEAAQQTVHFHGHVTKATLDDALRRARVAVFPSYAESFGNAPVESMAMGCATIYTRRSCGPEIVRDNQDGLLVDPENIEEITGSILRLLNDHSLNARLAAAGVDRVRQQYCPTRIAARNESFYADCIREFARRNNTREVGSRLQRA